MVVRGGKATQTPPVRAGLAAAGAGRPSLRELAERALLQEAVPAGALVNGRGDILYLHGRTGLYLEPVAGETGVSNVLQMAREGLRRGLSVALRDAAKTGMSVRRPRVRVKTNGDFSLVALAVHPVAGDPSALPGAPLYLVTLEVVDVAPDSAGLSGIPVHGVADGDDGVTALRHELRTKEELLQTANEELATSNEELMSSNEEMQSVNEELQSANEELRLPKRSCSLSTKNWPP